MRSHNSIALYSQAQSNVQLSARVMATQSRGTPLIPRWQLQQSAARSLAAVLLSRASPLLLVMLRCMPFATVA